MRLIYVLSALGSIAILNACDSTIPSAKVVYDCGALQLTANYSPQQVALEFGEQQVSLDAVESASGSRYVNREPELELWNKGSQAQLTIAGQAYPLCIDQSELPAQLSARGNEPFWLLQLNGTRASLRQPSGDHDYPSLEMSRLNDSESPAWAVQLNEAETLVVTRSICHDSMSGLPYPYSAQLTRQQQVMAGCAGEPRRLISGASWQLHGSELEQPPTIQFMSDDSVFGFSGCNRYQGKYELTGEGLRFQPLAATKMMCSSAQMQAEQEFFESLAQATIFNVGDNGNTLQLRNNGETLLRFVKSS